MKKMLCALLVLLMTFSLAACGDGDATTTGGDTGLIRVGIINNPPSESGYREANVKNFEEVFSEANGYETTPVYEITIDAQLNAAQQMITEGVDFLLISAAATDGWDSILASAKEAGIRVFLFDRMINTSPDNYEAAVVSDMLAEGTTAVNWLKAQNLPEYNVIHIQGAMGSDPQIGRSTPLEAEFAAGTMNKVAQQTATWDEAQAKQIVEAVINAGTPFNVIYAENDGMARGAVAALDEAGITHGVDGDVVIMGFDVNKWALRELLAGNWNYDGQCSPFQAEPIHEMIQTLESGGTITEKKVVIEEFGLDATTITEADIEKYGIGE
jgi:simple sugar transport system substrate-binding protein